VSTVAINLAGERPRPGLRERRKRLTATELEAAAIRLFSERGFDSVTVDDIAAEADVSRRTFFRYFASKDDVLLADHRARLAELREALAVRPLGEPILAALRNALLSLTDNYEEDRERLLIRGRIMLETPSLQARSLVHQRAWSDAMQAMAAERLGVDPAVDLRPSVVAATTLAAMRVAYTAWYAGGGQAHLPTMVAEALDLLDGGLQQVGRKP
jgi:AcrR family transcriptional regulator